jgi:hypothetical protein
VCGEGRGNTACQTLYVCDFRIKKFLVSLSARPQCPPEMSPCEFCNSVTETVGCCSEIRSLCLVFSVCSSSSCPFVRLVLLLVRLVHLLTLHFNPTDTHCTSLKSTKCFIWWMFNLLHLWRHCCNLPAAVQLAE